MTEKEKPNIFHGGYVEELVSQNRAPLFFTLYIGKEMRKEIMVVVPTADRQPTDYLEFSLAGTVDTLTAEGEVRGKSEYYYISPEESDGLEKRVRELTKAETRRNNPSIASHLRKLIPGIFK